MMNFNKIKFQMSAHWGQEDNNAILFIFFQFVILDIKNIFICVLSSTVNTI